MFFSFRSWLKRRFTPTRPRPFRRSTRLTVEQLDGRIVPTATTYTVINTGDSNTGSGASGDLLYCLNQANSNSGADNIVFSNSTSGGHTNFYDGSVHTITLSSALSITDSVDIQGVSATALVVNANHTGRVFDISDSSATKRKRCQEPFRRSPQFISCHYGPAFAR